MRHGTLPFVRFNFHCFYRSCANDLSVKILAINGYMVEYASEINDL